MLTVLKIRGIRHRPRAIGLSTERY
jgi:hypothetical protein